MRRYLTALSLAALLCFSSILSAQDTATSGETFTDFAAFEAEVCGTIVGGDFATGDFTVSGDGELPGVLGEVFESFELTQAIAGGQLEGSGSEFIAGGTIVEELGLEVANLEGDFCLVAGGALGGASAFTFTPDAGNVEGFCLTYGGAPTIEVFAGDTLIETIVPTPVLEQLVVEQICWLNTDLENVTRIEYSDSEGIVCGFRFAFGEQGCNDMPTCRSLLQDVIADVRAIVPTEGSYDQQALDCAAAYLDCADHDFLWSNDDQINDRIVFFFLHKATKHLRFVTRSPEAAQARADIQGVLSCIVDTEIEAAAAAGGDSELIECAEYFQSSADAYQEVGFLRKATLLRKLAWLKAVWAY